jgi:hypothetical protein
VAGAAAVFSSCNRRRCRIAGETSRQWSSGGQGSITGGQVLSKSPHHRGPGRQPRPVRVRRRLVRGGRARAARAQA